MNPVNPHASKPAENHPVYLKMFHGFHEPYTQENNMEAGNAPLEEEHHRLQTNIFRFHMLSFWGCIVTHQLPNIFVFTGAFTEEEAASLVSRAESQGFELQTSRGPAYGNLVKNRSVMS